MPFWKKSTPSTNAPQMKTITYRGGIVTFRIPTHWREEYSETEGGMFYEDLPDSGTLRLTIITMTTPEGQDPSALDVLRVVVNSLRKDGIEGTTKSRQDGNAVFRYEQASSEKGVRLAIFYRVVANPVPPNHARIATFSYAILAKHRNLPRTQNDRKMLDAEIDAASFSPELGVVAG